MKKACKRRERENTTGMLLTAHCAMLTPAQGQRPKALLKIYLFVWAHCMKGLTEARIGHQTPRSGVTGGLEPSKMGARN